MRGKSKIDAILNQLFQQESVMLPSLSLQTAIWYILVLHAAAILIQQDLNLDSIQAAHDVMVESSDFGWLHGNGYEAHDDSPNP
jgi:hypothetical protein